MWTYQVYTQHRSCKVGIEGGRIRFAPPIWDRFLGQPLDNLLAWLRKTDPPVAVNEINEERDYDAGNTV